MYNIIVYIHTIMYISYIREITDHWAYNSCIVAILGYPWTGSQIWSKHKRKLAPASGTIACQPTHSFVHDLVCIHHISPYNLEFHRLRMLVQHSSAKSSKLELTLAQGYSLMFLGEMFTIHFLYGLSPVLATSYSFHFSPNHPRFVLV